jgi:NAD(P)-dependent dehydrogenase (short-subunit alcohol dehydrogenase family)
MFNPFSLEGKTILVTGASSGLGQGIAIQCSKMGARVVLNGRNAERLKETLSQMEGENHLIVSADIATQEGIETVASEVPELDGYVNSAGIPSLIPLKNISRAYMENILGVNTIAPITLTALLVKKKKLKNKSSVVIIGSINGCCIGNAGSSPYSASKGALSGFIKAAALELAGRGTRINTISPGLVPTSMLGMNEEMYTREQLEEQMAPNYPMKRLGAVDDIANGAVYLLSDAASWVTGQNLVIDGGYTIA